MSLQIWLTTKMLITPKWFNGIWQLYWHSHQEPNTNIGPIESYGRTTNHNIFQKLINLFFKSLLYFRDVKLAVVINFLIWQIDLYLLCCQPLGLATILEMLQSIFLYLQFWPEDIVEIYETWHSGTGPLPMATN